MKKVMMIGTGLPERMTAHSLPEKGDGEEAPDKSIRKST